MPRLPAEGAEGVLCSFSKPLQLPEAVPQVQGGRWQTHRPLPTLSPTIRCGHRLVFVRKAHHRPPITPNSPSAERKKEATEGEMAKRDLIGVGTLSRVPLIKERPPWPVPPSVKARRLPHVPVLTGKPYHSSSPHRQCGRLHCTLEEISKQESGEQQKLNRNA